MTRLLIGKLLLLLVLRDAAAMSTSMDTPLEAIAEGPMPKYYLRKRGNRGGHPLHGHKVAKAVNKKAAIFASEAGNLEEERTAEQGGFKPESAEQEGFKPEYIQGVLNKINWQSETGDPFNADSVKQELTEHQVKSAAGDVSVDLVNVGVTKDDRGTYEWYYDIKETAGGFVYSIDDKPVGWMFPGGEGFEVVPPKPALPFECKEASESGGDGTYYTVTFPDLMGPGEAKEYKWDPKLGPDGAEEKDKHGAFVYKSKTGKYMQCNVVPPS